MSRPIGLVKTGGRKKGTPNRATAPLRERIEAHGIDLADELLSFYKEELNPVLRLKALELLLSYSHPKPKSVEESSGENVWRVVIQDYTSDRALKANDNVLSKVVQTIPNQPFLPVHTSTPGDKPPRR